MKKVLVILAVSLIIINIAALCAAHMERGDTKAVQSGVELTPGDPADVQARLPDGSRAVTVYMTDTQTVETLPLETYLVGVVASEMPASFEPEALKAQATAARTYILYREAHPGAGDAEVHHGAAVCTDSSHCKGYLSEKARAERWGDGAPAYEKKLREAVEATAGLVVTYEGEPIDAVFHAMSSGRTEDAVDVWGGQAPYLQSVASDGDREAANFETVATFTPEELQAALAGLAELAGDPETWLGAVTPTHAGSVQQIELGGTACSGGDVRAALGLRSNAFTAEYAGGVFIFTVHGYGHGVGMSQTGANAMALDGATFEEILTWYYTGVEIKKLE